MITWFYSINGTPSECFRFLTPLFHLWIARAEASEIKMLVKFAKTLRDHALGLLAWYDHPISTGPLEGTNNNIKTMKRQPTASATRNSSN